MVSKKNKTKQINILELEKNNERLGILLIIIAGSLWNPNDMRFPNSWDSNIRPNKKEKVELTFQECLILTNVLKNSISFNSYNMHMG